MSQLFIPSSPGQDQGTSNSQASRDGLSNGVFSDRPPQAPQFSFAAATNQVSHLANVLLSIAAVHRHALLVISRYGVTFYTEHHHILNVSATVDASLFSAFEYHWTCSDSPQNDAETPKNVSLGIDVQRLSDAFSAAAATAVVRGKNTRSAKSGNVSSASPESVLCYLKYRGEGYPLVVEFEDRLMSEQIEFATYHLDFDFPFGDENSESQASLPSPNTPILAIDHFCLRFEVILQSDILANLLQDLQGLGTEDLYMYVSNQPVAGHIVSANQMYFVSKGAIGYSKLTYPSARTLLQKLEVYRSDDSEPVPITDSVVSTLAFGPFIKVLRAVKLSSKCKIMKDFHGVFSVQLLCRNTAAKSYPGTLIAFNMLERSNIGTSDHSIDLNLDGLFDDKVYQPVEDPDIGAVHDNTNDRLTENAPNDVDEPFSYATFMRRPSMSVSAPKRNRNEASEPSATDLGSHTGSNMATLETPLFF